MSKKSESTTLSQLTLFAGDSLASLTVLPGSERARKMTATSGLNIAALLPSSDPASWLARMFLVSEPPCSTRCYLTWKVWTTPQRRSIFLLWPSMPPIDVSASGLWPTPQAQMPGAGPDNSKVQNLLTGNRHSFYLTQAVEAERQKPGIITRLWPTPSSQGSAGEISEDLERRGAKLVNAKTGRVLQTNLATEVKWHERQGAGQLNPTWVEWLMGFPSGWTDLEHSETP